MASSAITADHPAGAGPAEPRPLDTLMDPSLAAFLFLAFVIATVFSAYEMRLALDPPHCTECPHCRAAAFDKARRQQELTDAYARRWRLGDRDDKQRRR